MIALILAVLGLTVPPAVSSEAMVTGSATFYCQPGEEGTANCTAGHGPDDLVAAIDRKDTPYRKGDRVTVSHDGKSVSVLIVDVCACAGDRLIDLTSGAFRKLAPLSQGVIDVALSVDAPSPTLPPTDTLGGSDA